MRTVLLLEDDDDLRGVLASMLRACISEVEVLSLASYDELVTAGKRARDADLALLDVNLGPDVPSGLDAYRWLREHGSTAKIRFLTGHAKTHPLVEEAVGLADAGVLEKPVAPATIAALAAGA